ncbi:hypothetical protein [Acetobacter pomorum]|uniref:hypothetical protein n=1 Tax=Acetobacter pomorum TaxID=65959 RepID=UPI001F0801B2|nr:hypothetical protein [Acetobacter pomorum]
MARNRNVTVRLSDDELERLQEVAPDGNVAKYIRDTVLRQSKSDLKLVNMDDKLVELGQDMRLVSDILADLERKVSGKPAAAGETGSQEPGGIPRRTGWHGVGDAFDDAFILSASRAKNGSSRRGANRPANLEEDKFAGPLTSDMLTGLQAGEHVR